MVANQKVSFVDADDVLSLESQGHYTRVLTREGYHFCNLSIGDLELRLDPELFLRVHRCFIVNLRAVRELGRDGTKTHVILKGPATPHVPVSRGVLSRLKGALGLG
jgi:LytTR family transcriptional regulator, CO-responsive transcriptional regulator RcoM